MDGCAVDGYIARGYIAVLNQQFTVNGYIGPCFYVSQLSKLCKLHEQASLVPRLPSSFAQPLKKPGSLQTRIWTGISLGITMVRFVLMF